MSIIKYLKLIFLFVSPILFFSTLTIIGIYNQRRGIIAISGASIFTYLFIIYLSIDKLLQKTKYWSVKLKALSNKDEFSFLKPLSQFLNPLLSIPFYAVSFLRSLILSFSFWMIDFYLSILETNVVSFLQTSKLNLVFSVIVILIGTFDLINKRTLNEQKVSTRILSFFGYYQFFRNYTLLFIASAFKEHYSYFKIFFTDPLWFTYKFIYIDLILFAKKDLFLSGIFVFIVIPILGIYSTKGDKYSSNPDALNFAYAMRFFCIWIFSFPIVFILCEMFNYCGFISRYNYHFP